MYFKYTVHTCRPRRLSYSKLIPPRQNPCCGTCLPVARNSWARSIQGAGSSHPGLTWSPDVTRTYQTCQTCQNWYVRGLFPLFCWFFHVFPEMDHMHSVNACQFMSCCDMSIEALSHDVAWRLLGPPWPQEPQCHAPFGFGHKDHIDLWSCDLCQLLGSDSEHVWHNSAKFTSEAKKMLRKGARDARKLGLTQQALGFMRDLGTLATSNDSITLLVFIVFYCKSRFEAKTCVTAVQLL